jgi:antitoxin HicB
MSDYENKISEILRQPYSRVLTPELDGTYSAQVTEFPGCFSYGDSPADAYANLEEAARNWLSAALEQGLAVPEPLRPEDASGRFALRMPKSLHARLTLIAAHEAVSLNQLIVSVLSERAGAETVARAVTREFGKVMQAVGKFAVQQRQASTTRFIPLDPKTTTRMVQTSGTQNVLPQGFVH